MTSGMLQQQETAQTSPSGSGPRFRPYASPNHHLTKGRYITSNDVRGYIPVYEYPLNGQWIMMDIDDGYILWTGIWKALGNSKADIVKMIDSQPDLAPLIRRVRGGYLKIQGTWMPYEVALKLSRRVAWTIRDDLIPLFGPTFPSTCLSPDQPGYGQVVPTGQGRRRARRATQSAMMQQIPRAPAGWTVVTPSMPTTSMPIPHGSVPEQQHHHHGHHLQNHQQYQAPLLHALVRSPPQHQQDYAMDSPYSTHAHTLPPSERYSHSPTLTIAEAQHQHQHQQHQHQQRYSSGASHPPTSFRKLSAPTLTGSSGSSSGGKPGLSLDIRALSMREHRSGSSSSVAPSPQEDMDIRLPPIRAPPEGAPRGEYALPPISAMEDGAGGHDSAAAVLRRLRMDDGRYPHPKGAARSVEDLSWARRHSLSAHPSSSSKPLDISPRFQPYTSPRSYQEHGLYRPRSSSSSTNYSSHHHPHRTPKADPRPVWSKAASHGGDSTSNPSPTSPTTPNSLADGGDERTANGSGRDKDKGRDRDKDIAGRLGSAQWPSARRHGADDNDDDDDDGGGRGRISSEPSSASFAAARRNSYEVQSDSDLTRPHRPW